MNDTNDEEDKKSEAQETFRDKFRRRLFQVYFELMKERYVPLMYSAIIVIIMGLQLIGYIYYRKTDFPFDDDLFSSIAGFLDIVRIFPAVESTQSTALYLATIFLMNGFLLIYVLQVVFIDYSISIGKFYFNFPVKLVGNMSSLLIWVLASPITETMVSIFDCDGSHHKIMLDVQCWGGAHIFYCIFCMLTLILFILVAATVALLYNESRPTSVDAFSRLDTSMELYLLLYRVGLGIVSVYGTSNAFQWILSVIHILGSFNFVKLYFKYLPFYNPYMSVVYGACMCSYLWASFNLIVSMVLQSEDYTGQSIVIILGILIIIPLVRNLREKAICRMLFEYKHDKIKDEHELDLYIKKIIDLMSDQTHSEVDEMVLLGFVNNHKNECSSQDCPLTTNEALYLPATDAYSPADRKNLKDPIILRHLLNSIFLEYVKNSNSTAVLHIIYSHFLFIHIGNIHMALIELNAAEKLDTTTQQKLTIYRSKRFIESYLMNRYKKKNKDTSKQIFENLDVTLVITFENLYGKLQKAIEKSASEHIEFWSHLDSLLPDMNTLHQIGLNIINYSKQTQDIWTKLIKINSNYRKALRNYGYYLNEIKNDEEEGREYIEKAKSLEATGSMDEHMNDFDVMFADDTAIIVISGSKETQGKITKTNTGITNLFKYNTLEVTGHDVNILMPQIIASKHQTFLERFFKTGKEKVINKESELFAMPRSGFVISISAIMKPVPSLKDDIQYISLIRERHKEYDYILTNDQGKIDSASAWISGLLHLQPNFLKENEVYIQLLCPELLDMMTTVENSVCTKLEMFQGTHDLTFILPANFVTLIQNFAKNPNAAQRTESMSEEDHADNAGVDIQVTGESMLTSVMTKPGEAAGRKSRKIKVPEIVKKIWYMIHGSSFSSKNNTSKNILKDSIKYNECEYKRTWRVDITDRTFGDGMLKVKVFRILRDKNPDDLTEKSSEKFYGVQRTHSHTRAAPEAIEHLKSVGLDPASSSNLSRNSRHDDLKKGEESADSASHSNDMSRGEDDHKEKPKERSPPTEEAKMIKEIKVELPAAAPAKPVPGETEGREESKQTERIIKRTEEDQLKDSSNLDISLTSITDPKNAGSMRDLSKLNISVVSPGSKAESPPPAAQKMDKLPEPVVSGTLNASMMSDINASRMDERPLIIDVTGNEKQRVDVTNLGSNPELAQTPQKEPERAQAWREKYLRKGSKMGLEEQEQVIRNYLKQDEIEKKTPAAGEGKENEKDEKKDKEAPKEKKKENTPDDDVGSVASGTKSLLKHLRALRKAVYEQYCPRSVTQLQYVARFVFLALFVITLVYFLIAKGLYDDLKSNIDNIFYSKSRFFNTVGVGASVRALVLINPYARTTNVSLIDLTIKNATDYYKDGYADLGLTSMTYDAWVFENLETYAVALKDAQNALSTSKFTFSDENIELINPSAIQISYKEDTSIADSFSVDCWSAIMGLVTHSLKVQHMSLADITANDSSVYYVLVNSFNSILSKIEGSTSAILAESHKSANGNRKVLMVLLIVASVAITVSVIIIIQVVVKVKQNKEDILVLFTEIPSKSIKTQLNKCRRCFNSFREEDKTGQNEQNIDVEEEEEKEKKEEKEGEGKEEGEEGDDDDDKKPDDSSELLKEERTTHRGSRKVKKKFKPYSTNIFVLLLKFLFFVAILEGYFMLSYFKSAAFLNVALDLIDELGAITQRSNSNGYLYNILQEYVGTNGTSTLLGEASETYVIDKINETIRDQESFLKLHSNNIGSNNADYNSFFDQLIYENVCNLLFGSNATLLSDCNGYDVLLKGLHSSNVAFWDGIRGFANDFQNTTSRTNYNISSTLTDSRLITYERLQNRYFIYAYEKLQEMLDDGLEHKFTVENELLLILFICYLIAMAIMYFFLWSIFIESTRHSLWVTKSMLAIIPVNTIQEVRSIKEFLMQTSQSLFIGIRSD
ncbi:MAG: hypothetical protein P4M11_15230 [Candidatus Pacebacteria bacterium]|nr:hypothetical protein [Candidatus Paceibacterota bacterium]